MEVSNFLKEYLTNEYKLSPEMKILISNDSFRENLYKIMNSNFQNDFHSLLRELLNEEMIYRTKADDEDYDGEYFENIYWCSLFLYKIGSLDDVNILWQAKTIDFDTYCAFDIQFLVGAGLDKTIGYLQSKTDESSKNALQYILDCKKAGAFEDMESWYKFRENYFRVE